MTLPYQPPRAAREQDRARRERRLDKWVLAVIVAGIVGAYTWGAWNAVERRPVVDLGGEWPSDVQDREPESTGQSEFRGDAP